MTKTRRHAKKDVRSLLQEIAVVEKIPLKFLGKVASIVTSVLIG